MQQVEALRRAPIKRIFWDVDGTMIDTETPWFAAHRQVFSEQEPPHHITEEMWAEHCGSHDFDPHRDLYAKATQRSLSAEHLREIDRRTRAAIATKERVRPGVLELMDHIRHVGGGNDVVTNGRQDWHSWVLGVVFPDPNDRPFERVWAPCFAPHLKPKPAPDLYRAAAAARGLAPQECLVVEDSAHGATAAVAAGMHCIVTPTRLSRRGRFPEGAVLMTSQQLQQLPKNVDWLDGRYVPASRRGSVPEAGRLGL